MAEREASGDSDYRLDDPANADGLTSHDHASETEIPEKFDYLFSNPDDGHLDDPDESFGDNAPESDDDGHFDAFNNNTWSFQPAPAPWYRSKQAVTAMIAAAAAMAAIVISGVLLVFRGPNNTVEVTTSVTPTAPTSAAPTELATNAPPPPLAPPPPPETSASSVNTAPGSNYPSVRPPPSKEPEIGVTRTPVTRLPISVAPQQRKPRS